MQVKMQSSQSSCNPSNAANVTHNVNLSFEIGTSHIHASGRNSLQDDSVSNEHVARAHFDDENGKPQGKSRGSHRNGRSGFSTNRVNYFGNPRGMRPNDDRFSRKQESQSNDNSSGSEAIGQYVNGDGKPKGMRHSQRRPIIADTTLEQRVSQDFSSVETSSVPSRRNKAEYFMQVHYPYWMTNSESIRKTEEIALSILKTASVPGITNEKIDEFISDLIKINKI